MRVHPGVTDSAAVGEVNGHSMRAGHDFQAAVGQSGGVDGEIGGQMLDLAYVVVGGRVEVRFEAVALRHFVVDLVFEEDHVLERSKNGTSILTATKSLLYVSMPCPGAKKKGNGKIPLHDGIKANECTYITRKLLQDLPNWLPVQ